MALKDRLKQSISRRSGEESPLLNVRSEVASKVKSDMAGFKLEIINEVLSKLDIESVIERVLTSGVREQMTPKKGVHYMDGKDGKNGMPGRDGKDGVGLVGPKGKDGKDGSPDTPDQVITKINKAEKKIKPEQIEGLKEAFKGKRGGGGGGGGVAAEFQFTGDGSTTSFTLSANVSGNKIVAHYQGQYLHRGTHFTISGKTLTTTFTPENNSIIEGWFIRT